MNKKIIVFMLFVLMAPSFSFAQVSLADSSNEASTTRRERIRSWHRESSELAQKISALPAQAVIIIPIPVLFGVTLKNIFPNFGDSRGGGTRTHEGEDIMAIKGTPIVSPTQAVVIRTGTGSTEGHYVYTANPGGETFVYMHLDKIGEGVISGTVLEVGSLIGYVGNTGNASGGAAHLHFEIHDSLKGATDPFPRIGKEFTVDEKNTYLAKIMTQTTDPSALSNFISTNFLTKPVAVLKTLTNSSVRNLFKGLVGEDVRNLQKFLNTQGFIVATVGAGSAGNETTYFGTATQAALIKFQTAHNISPAAGYYGPITRLAVSVL